MSRFSCKEPLLRTFAVLCGRVVLSGGMWLSACLLCAGCTQMDQLERDVRSLERKLSDLRSFQAEQTGQISVIEGQLRELSGSVEELRHGRAGLPTADYGGVLKPEVGVPASRLPPAVVPLATLDADEGLAAGLARPSAARAFIQALSEIRSGRFNEAMTLLQRAQEENFQGEGTAEIVFWKGVCADGLGDNRRALAAYGELVADFPKSPRAALGLLRQGSVFVRMGDVNTARLSFQKLIAEFPSSPEASTARLRLKDL